MSRIINVWGSDIILEKKNISGTSVCDVCSYRDKNENHIVKDPVCQHIIKSRTDPETFFDVCRSSVIGLAEYPKEGTLDNFLCLLPETVLGMKESIIEYCKNYCLIDCQIDCPLYKFKTE